LGQLLRVRGIAGNEMVSLELIEAPVAWRIIERDRRFALGQALAPKGHRRSLSDPDLAWLEIEFVAEANSDNRVATVKDKKLVASAAGGWIGVVGRDNLRERVAFANDKIGHNEHDMERGGWEEPNGGHGTRSRIHSVRKNNDVN
jgi:hypothetical protein